MFVDFIFLMFFFFQFVQNYLAAMYPMELPHEAIPLDTYQPICSNFSIHFLFENACLELLDISAGGGALKWNRII